MELKPVLENTSVRARVAFVLAIAEHALPLLKKNQPFFDLACVALDSAWEWECGGDVTGEKLYSYLENYDDEGLLIYEWESSGDEEAASIVITSAIAYVSWHAYRQAGQSVMPSSIHEVSEETITQVIDYAMKTSTYDSQQIDDLATRCLASYRTDNPNELGEQIKRDEFIQATRK